MSVPVFVPFLDADGNAVQVNDFDNIAYLREVPPEQSAPLLVSLTSIQFDDRVLIVQGKLGPVSVALTNALGVSFGSFNDMNGAAVLVNVLDNIAALATVPAIQLPPGVTDGTSIRFDQNTLRVQGTLAATLALISGLPPPLGAQFIPAAAMFFGISGVAGAPDYPAPFGVNAPIPFPQNGDTSGGPAAPTRLTATTFQINQTGLYEVSYQVSISEAGQLALRVNGAAVPSTRRGRASVTDLIDGSVFIKLTKNDVVSVNNDVSAGPLTVTPTAGGTAAVGAMLSIMRIG